ncbi:MAG: hypothetical protein M1834_001055 [Cirrosporium novae-zelandiae]|nr:MAG: hypothetical protein M1834_001055 [Cirrosporium novae-zelandiae]
MTSYNMTYCGCYLPVLDQYSQTVKSYLPQISTVAKSAILSDISRTTLTQTFFNGRPDPINEVQYAFPLYDGVTVIEFSCCIGPKVIKGIVKEKEQAKTEFKEATERGEAAGLLEQLPAASDCFTAFLGNIPANEKVVVEITYIGELKHDSETDGIRFTIPTIIAPRYGSLIEHSLVPGLETPVYGGLDVIVDITLENDAFVKEIVSPSHQIGVTIGQISTASKDSMNPSQASAKLALEKCELEKDFILLVRTNVTGKPKTLLEHHPKLGYRALMATLVPKSNLPQIRPEIVFVIDRSGSMGGKVQSLKSALTTFLKSLPVGVKFNICSFGTKYSFLWKQSKSYNQSNLDHALSFCESIDADFGGTEMLEPVKATVENRYKDMQLEVMILTDGEIWRQNELFDFITESTSQYPIRFFSLGIGVSVSHSLIEGIARAGKGFAQLVGDNEKFDKKVVRMLKGALSPHIDNYTLEVKYVQDTDDTDFEMVESVTEGLQGLATHDPTGEKTKPITSKDTKSADKAPISLYNTSSNVGEPKEEPKGRYNHLPEVILPKLLQAPQKIPPLFPFNRTSIYLLITPEACKGTPQSVILKATSDSGPLELEISVQDVGNGETIHQLAAKKAVLDLEEGRGWLREATTKEGKKLREAFEGRYEDMVEREAVRLGVTFQVGGKWCSFVALENNKPGYALEVHGTDERCEFAKPGGIAVRTQQIRLISTEGAACARRSNYVKHKSFGINTVGSDPSNAVPAVCYMAKMDDSPAPPPPPSEADSKLQQLIGLQHFDGSFTLNNNLLTLCNVQSRNELTKFGLSENDIGATMIAIIFFETMLKGDEESWELVVEKARNWLNEKGVNEGWEEKAKGCIGDIRS